MKEHTSWALWIFNATYLFWGGAYFILDLDVEFLIYIVIISFVIGGTLLTAHQTRFPAWQLWLLSLWGLFYVLSVGIQVGGDVLYEFVVHPIFDVGGDIRVLKFGQFLQYCVYGLTSLMSLHILRRISITKQYWLLAGTAVLISLGIGSVVEILKFFLVILLESITVGEYKISTLTFIFNLLGAVSAVFINKFFIQRVTPSK